MRSYRPVVVFLIGAVLLGIGLLMFSPFKTELCEKGAAEAQHNCPSYHIVLVALWKIGESLSDSAFLTALATIAIAAFTYTLYKATSGLVEAAQIQSNDMKSSIAAAEKAGAAAKKSAEISETLLTDLERPWIFIHLHPHLGGEDDHKFKLPYVLFDIANYGRMPAIVDQCHIALGRGETKPDSALLQDEFHGVIGPHDKRKDCKLICPEGREYGTTVDLANDTHWPTPIIAQDEEFFFYILIQYLDINWKPHVTSACWSTTMA